MNKETILIADDEKNARESLSKILSQEGYTVIQAKNGKEAMRLVRKNPVELVITDLRMPEQDGFSLFLKLKKNFPDIRVILMTAYGTVESAVEAMKEGISDYLTKPINV